MAPLSRVTRRMEHSCEEKGGSADTCIECLILTHREKLDELRVAVAEHICEDQHDDVFLIRYLLSFKTVKDSVGPIERAVKWRKENATLVDMAWNGAETPEYFDVCWKLAAGAPHKYTRQGNPVLLNRVGHSNFKALLNEVPAEHFVEFMNYIQEWCYAACDLKTRETGRLTKALAIKDYQHFRYMSLLKDGFDRRMIKLAQEMSYLGQDLRPQFIQAQMLTHMPGAIQVLLDLARRVLPASAFEKLRVPKKPFEELLDYIDEEDIPTFLGGKCNCPTGCVPGVPNDSKKSVARD